MPVHNVDTLRASYPRPIPGAQSVRRACAILRILAEGREAGVALSEVARVTGVPRPTVHRIVGVLVEEGILERKPRTRRYAIGEQVSFLALARSSRSALLAAAQRPLAALSNALGDTLFLTIRTGVDTLCVARRLGPFPIQVLSIDVGVRRPLGVSSGGIVLLSVMPEDDASEGIHRNQERFRRYRQTVATALQEVAAAREDGFCVRAAGIVPGTKSISVPVRVQQGSSHAAITLVGVSDRLPSRRDYEIISNLRRAAADIEKALRMH
jgi:DNA-binding IclR family transcriptional regulator